MLKEAPGMKVHATRNELFVIAMVLACDASIERLRSLTVSQQSSMMSFASRNFEPAIAVTLRQTHHP